MLLFMWLACGGGPVEGDKNQDSALDSGTPADTNDTQDTNDTNDTQDTNDTADTSDSGGECGVDSLQFRAEVRNGGAPCANNTCSLPFEVVGVVFNPCEEAVELPLTAGCLVKEWVVFQNNTPTAIPAECNPNPSTMGIPPQQKREALIEWTTGDVGQAKLVVQFNNPQQTGADLNFNIQ